MKRAGVGCTRPGVGRETHTALRDRHSCILSSVCVKQQELQSQWVYVEDRSAQPVVQCCICSPFAHSVTDTCNNPKPTKNT
jgi:hypothetical protein